MANRFFSFFSLYFGLCFATPLLITLTNRQDLAFSLPWLSFVSLCLVFILSSVSYYLSEKTPFSKLIATAALSCAFIFAIQGNVVHDLFYYGQFNGQSVDWRQYGWKFWLEWCGFLLAFPFFYWLLSRARKLPLWIVLIPVLSSILLVTPALLNQQDQVVTGFSDDDIDPEVFQFSSELNLIHLIPDGFQGDIAREVLENEPELAARLAGFTLYRDHLGMYQGTAPSIPTIFTGRTFDLADGHNFNRVIDDLESYSFPARLLESGYRLDYVTIAAQYCLKGASSCVVRPFNDMRSRGYYRHHDDSFSHALRLLSDLSLFRSLPMFLKERVYNDGKWFFSDHLLGGSSPWPDPALREWIQNMTVARPAPRFKSYHYIGTHIPPYWDASCTYHPDLEQDREQYYEQSVCVLTGIADFADRLRELGIFDQTAIIISGDHGIYIDPDDLEGVSANADLQNRLLGAARPLLFVKPLKNNKSLEVSNLPTSLLDIAPTALGLVGLDGNYTGKSVMTIEPGSQRDRLFYRYEYDEFWSGEAVSHDTWLVNGAVADLSNWSLQDIFYNKSAPSAYPAINYNALSKTSRGLSLNQSEPDSEAAWIGGASFSILVGTQRPGDLATITLAMRLPAFMNEKVQTFSVDINNQALEQKYSLNKDEDWSQIEIPVPGKLLRKGNNLITLTFVHTAKPEEHKNWHTAGELRSFKLLQ